MNHQKSKVTNSQKKTRKSASQGVRVSNQLQNDQQTPFSVSKGNKWHKIFREKMYLNSSYMKSFIKKASSDSFKCLKCTDNLKKKTGKETMYCENIYSHILSDMHKNNTPKPEEEKYNTLKQLIQETLQRKKTKESKKEEVKGNKCEKSYLGFIAFLVSQRLSYSQISKIGRFLQNLYEKDELDFLQNNHFDEETISKIVSDCFRPILQEDLQEKLMSSKFSISIDTSTIVSETICAIKVKFAEHQGSFDQNIQKIENKLIGITSFKGSSDGIAYLEAVKEKFFVMIF